MLTLSPCEERRWEAGWRGVREAPPAPPAPSRNAEGTDGPLAPSPASVPEIPPSGYEREALFYCKCVCVSHDVCPEGRWLAQRLSCWSRSPGLVGAVW